MIRWLHPSIKQYVELTSSFHVEATFKNGILALQYLQNCTVDLIILDYYTPQMNGDEFIDSSTRLA